MRISPLMIAIGVSAVFALANSAAFFAGVIKTPPGTEYLGTVHYWEDYFFYLNHFYQGAHGAILTVNRYTPEPTQTSIIYWANVAAGRLFSIIGFPPVIAYNVSLILLAFLAGFTGYLLLKRITGRSATAFIGLIIALSATSLQNRVLSAEGKMIFWPFQIWKTPHFAFDRLGGAPHQLLLTVLVTIFLYLYLNKLPRKPFRQLAILGILIIAVTTIQLAQGAVTVALLAAAEGFWSLTNKRADRDRIIKLAILLPVTAVTALYMFRLFETPPHVQTKIWEASQHSYTNLPFLIKSIGPVLILAAIGIATRFRRFLATDWYGIFMIAAGYIMFMSRLPQAVGISNVRLLFPSTYLFWGLFAAYGINYLSELISKKFRLTAIKVTAVLTVFFLSVSAPTLVWEINRKLSPVDPGDHLLYLPEDILTGFKVLENTGSPDEIVTANPATHLDSLVPPLSGHTTYSGHMLQTTDNAGKQAEAVRLFSGVTQPDAARLFLNDNRISYVLFTRLDGDLTAFAKRYEGVLKSVYSDNAVTVFAVPD